MILMLVLIAGLISTTIAVPFKRIKRNQMESYSFNFDCSGRPIGFYADPEFNCRIFHMCDEKGKRIPHSCAEDTGFNQEFRICDWENNFDCKEAPKWYFLNYLTYATDNPEEDEQ